MLEFFANWLNYKSKNSTGDLIDAKRRLIIYGCCHTTVTITLHIVFSMLQPTNSGQIFDVNLGNSYWPCDCSIEYLLLEVQYRYREWLHRRVQSLLEERSLPVLTGPTSARIKKPRAPWNVVRQESCEIVCIAMERNGSNMWFVELLISVFTGSLSGFKIEGFSFQCGICLYICASERSLSFIDIEAIYFSTLFTRFLHSLVWHKSRSSDTK